MKKIFIALLSFGLFMIGTNDVRAETLSQVDFEDASGYVVGSGPANYWGLAALEGTAGHPSFYTTGGSQSGNIFYGYYGKGGSSDPAPTITIPLPDLSNFENLQLSVSVAAPDCTVSTCWEITHRDRFVIYSDLEEIDRFLPTSGVSALKSVNDPSRTLHYQFQDLTYQLSDNSLRSVTFEFASSADDETIGIDSVMITGDLIAPKSKEDCKSYGWKNYGFRNQGLCISSLMRK